MLRRGGGRQGSVSTPPARKPKALGAAHRGARGSQRLGGAAVGCKGPPALERAAQLLTSLAAYSDRRLAGRRAGCGQALRSESAGVAAAAPAVRGASRGRRLCGARRALRRRSQLGARRRRLARSRPHAQVVVVRAAQPLPVPRPASPAPEELARRGLRQGRQVRKQAGAPARLRRSLLRSSGWGGRPSVGCHRGAGWPSAVGDGGAGLRIVSQAGGGAGGRRCVPQALDQVRWRQVLGRDGGSLAQQPLRARCWKGGRRWLA